MLPRATDSKPASVAADDDIRREAFETWRAKVAALPLEQRNEFLAHGRSDLKDQISALEGLARNKRNSSRARRIAKLINPLYELNKVLASVAADPWLSQLDPSHSSLVLGCVGFILSLSSKFIDFYDKVLDGLASMLEKLPVVERFEALYASRDASVTVAAVNICADILTFCVEASKLFIGKNGKIRSSARMLLSSSRGFDAKFGELQKDFDKHVAAFEQCIHLAAAERQEKFMLDREARDVREAEDTELWRMKENTRDVKMELRAKEGRRRDLLERIPAASLQNVQDDKLERCLPGTGKWLLEHESFQSWLSSESESALLWVHGKHGCGKSHLAARIIDHLSTRAAEADTALAYIYCNPIDSSSIARNQSNVSNEKPAAIDLDRLFGTLLTQLLRQLPVSESLPSLESAFESSRDARPTRAQLKTAIAEALSKLKGAFIVIDGLDECHKLGASHFAHFCDFIASLVKPEAGVVASKVILFSRPNYEEIHNAFDSYPQLQVDNGANSSDIERFITTKMSSLKAAENVTQEVVEKLAARADGMFLWVDLVSGSLQSERSIKGIRKAIENLPEGLDTVYEWSMARILNQWSRTARDRALNILLWTANATKPLRREEMLEALAIEPGMSMLDEETRLASDDGFLSECADLVVLRDGRYQLLHSSLQDFLEATPGTGSPVLKTYGEMQGRADEILAETCLTYLSFDTFDRDPPETEADFDKLLDDNPFYHYASLNWGVHAVKADFKVVLRSAKTFLSRQRALDLSMLHLLLHHPWSNNPTYGSIFPYQVGTTPLHMLAVFNLWSIAQAEADTWPLVHVEDGFGVVPFTYAVMSDGHLGTASKEIGNWILDRYYPLSVEEAQDSFRAHLHPKAIHVCTITAWEEALKRIVDLGVDLEAPYFSDLSPVFLAAIEGAESSMKLLLEAGANPNTRSIGGIEISNYPLIWAAGNKGTAIMEMLLQYGADVNVQDGRFGDTALHISASKNDIKTVTMLLDHGALVDIKNSAGVTAAMKAVSKGHSEVAKLLIVQHKADALAFTNDGETFLHMAALCDTLHLDIVKLLLELGVEPTARRKDGRTALHHAAILNHVALFEYFLSEDPDLDLRPLSHWEEGPLHAAAFAGATEVIKLLLERDPNQIEMANKRRELPLHLAADCGHLPSVKLLLTPSNIEARNIHEQTPLLVAARQGQLSVVSFLLEEGSDKENKDANGSTALFTAVQNGHLTVAQLLVSAGADINSAQKSGYTVLHAAVNSNDSRLITLLLDAGANVEARDRLSWQSPYLFAFDKQRLAAINLFQERGLAAVSAPDRIGRTPVHLAVMHGNPTLLESVLEQDTYPGIGELDYGGHDLMCIAAMRGYTVMIEPLNRLGLGPDGLGKQIFSDTPLTFAARSGHLAFVKALCAAGADVHHVGDGPYRRNALHWAILCCNHKTATCLLNAGADPTQRDGLGLSAMDYARLVPQMSEPMFGRQTQELAESCKSAGHILQNPKRQASLRKSITENAANLLSLRIPLSWAEEEDALEHYSPEQALLSRNKQVKLNHRGIYLECLAEALELLATCTDASAYEDADLCFTELELAGEAADQKEKWIDCMLCCKDIGESGFKCTVCQSRVLCRECYNGYLEAGKRVPEPFSTLRKLNFEAAPIRMALEPLRLNIGLLSEVVCNFDAVSDWVERMVDKFQQWNETHNYLGELYLVMDVPGWEFAEICSRLWQLHHGSLSDGKSADAVALEWRKLENDLTHHFWTYSASGEYDPPYDCEDHPYREIFRFDKLKDEEKAYFDGRTRLVPEYFAKLLQKYSHSADDVGIEDTNDDTDAVELAKELKQNLEDTFNKPKSGSSIAASDETEGSSEKKTDLDSNKPHGIVKDFSAERSVTGFEIKRKEYVPGAIAECIEVLLDKKIDPFVAAEFIQMQVSRTFDEE